MNKARMLKTIIFALGLFIVAGSAWVMREAIAQVVSPPESGINIVSPEKLEEVKPAPTGVPRQISYMGRLKEARTLMSHDYYSLASNEIAQALKQKPDHIEPYLILAEIYLRSGDVWKLENLILELEKRFPQSQEIIVIRTRQWIAARKFSEVLEIMKTSEQLPPELEFYKAVLLALQNNHDGAREILQNLQQLDVATETPIVSEEGLIDPYEGERVLTQEVSLKTKELSIVYEEFDNLAEGKNAHLFAELAKVLATYNEGTLARELADTAIKEDVRYIDAWILRGYAQMLLRDYHLAELDLRHAYELDPLRPETQYFLALTLFEQKKLDEAALFFEKALDYDFEFSAEVRWKLLDIFSAQQKYDQVIELYRDLLDYDTESERFISAIHTAVDLLKQPSVALEFSTILYDQDPSDVMAANVHGWALIANEKYVEAGQILEAAQAEDPQNPRTYLNLGLLYEQQDKIEDAKRFYKKCYELGKDNPNYTSVVNLAVDKFNKLIEAEERPQSPMAPINPPNSP
jgi:tetratricopeptide (TPR) repeat protein